MELGALAARVLRGQTVESVHRAHTAVADADGTLHAWAGNPHEVTFTRSTLKPFQLLPMVASGAADRFGFTEAELALMCASHNGEPAHVKGVAGILERLNLGPEALQCGAHAPYHKESAEALTGAPSPLHNNCSGKHAGMLALARHLDAPLDSYLDSRHPVQVRIREAVARFSGVPEPDLLVGTDGCSAPNYAMPVSKAARLGATLVRPPEGKEGDALLRIAQAMVRHPWEVGGTDRFDTDLMETGDGRLLAKAGGEGVELVADLESGRGLFLKIVDGSSRAVAPATIECARQLMWLEDRAFEVLGEWWMPTVKNHRKLVVGRVEPAIQLQFEGTPPLKH